ncbi:MAG: glycosyltransferase [Phycisphaerae bacterium]|nr:glycosyltransferase [Phycisphaerae bacterium]
MVTICHITIAHSPFDVRIFHKECTTLARTGYDVHLVVPHERDETQQDVHIHALPIPRTRLEKLFVSPWLAYRKVLALHPKPAICHFHDPTLLPVGQALRLHGYKVIFDVHENVSEQILTKEYLPGFLRRIVSVTYFFLEKLLTSGLATVHVLDSIAKQYRPPKVTVRNLPILPAALVEKGPPTDGPVRLVYTGALTRQRGAMTMLEAARKLRERGVDFHLEIIGPVQETGLEKEMEQFISDAGLHHHVIMMDKLPFQQCQERMMQVDIGLCLFLPSPNNLNSLPNKLLEYMSMGLAVVTSDFDCWRQYVRDTGGGVQVNPLDPRKITEVIEALFSQPETIRDMGRRGQQAVLSRFTWDQESKKLVEFYAHLLSFKGSSM